MESEKQNDLCTIRNAPMIWHGLPLTCAYVRRRRRFFLTSVSAYGMYLSRRYLWMAWTGEHCQ